MDFNDLSLQKRIMYIEKISNELLGLWNDKPETDHNYGSFFISLLTMRLGPTGRFICGATESLKNPEKPIVLIDGQAYPNPCFYIDSGSFGFINETPTFLKGRVHGDLHGGNIICTPDFDEYMLIDYSHYKREAFLFYLLQAPWKT